MRTLFGISVAALAALAISGCGDVGVGDVRVDLNGEEASRTGWPVAAGDETIAFADGWSVGFEHVVVSVADFRLEKSSGDAAMLSVDPIIADLHQGQPEAWVFRGVSARRWDRVGYRFVPASEGARNLDGVPEDIVERMVDEGYSFWLSGRAEREGETYTFEWGLPLTIDNDECVNGTDETDGLVVRDNGIVEAEVTVHLDHLFFDSLAADEPNMRFDPMAAVADDDGRVTLEALASQSLSDLRGLDGEPLVDEEGSPVIYDPGSYAVDERDLQQFVLAAATTMGHFNGEGHCEYTRE